MKVYLTDTSSEAEKGQQDHNASWAAALNASDAVRKVTFSYSSSDASGKLNTNEVYFYTTTAEAAYAKGSEGISGASGKTQQLSKAIADSTDGTYANTAVGQANAVTIGYLHVRFDGSQRLHSGSYGATIVSTAGTGAAAANA